MKFKLIPEKEYLNLSNTLIKKIKFLTNEEPTVKLPNNRHPIRTSC